HFAGECVELVDHSVDRVLQLKNFAAHVHRDFAREIAARHGGCHFGDVANLRCKVAGHEVDTVGQIFPRTADALHIGLSAEFAFGADLARHTRHFAGERVEL